MEFYLLRTFHEVMTERGFSAAARSLGVTQSSVSQQIARLEQHVGARLFQRVGREVMPTPAAQDLNRLAVSVLEQVREFEETLQKKQSAPAGLVRYAMPESCQWTPHYKWVMGELRAFPGIRTEVSVLPNDRIVALLLDGTLDFGFVVAEKPRTEFSYEKFSDERYSAVAASRAALADDRLIKYPGSDLYLATWGKGTGTWKRIRKLAENPILEVGTLAGAIHAVKGGSGLSVVPTHCVAEELASGALVEAPVPRTGHPSNPIYLVRRRGERSPHRVEIVLELLKRSKKGAI